MNIKKPVNKISKDEEIIQRALGTLPKYMVSVSRKSTTTSFSKVYVTAASEAAALERAKEIIKNESKDDTAQDIEWADNATITAGKPKLENIRNIPENDYLAHRFTKKGQDELQKNDKEGNPISIDDLGTVM